MTDSRSPIRALRAALFASVCVTLAAVGHSSVSGHDLPVAAVLLAFPVTLAAAWLAGNRRRGVLTIGAGLLTVQGVLHLIFAGADSHGSSAGARRHTAGAAATAASTTAADASAAHAMGSDPMAASAMGSGADSMGAAYSMGADTMTADAIASATTQLPHLTAGSGGMLAAHVLAAAVCALWLARGEAAFFRLARTVGTLAFAPLRLLLAVVRVPELPHPVRPRPRTRRLHGVVLAHSVSLRGPPGRPFTRATAPGVNV
ncbi:hypothetical protein ACWGI8_39010 [Streptomyces sp. NPDC054841]